MVEPGIYYDIPAKEYHKIPALNSGRYLPLSKSPAHAMTPKEQTPAMKFGGDYHCAQLESDRYEAEYAVPPKIDKRTKSGKLDWAAWQRENEGKEYISQEDHDDIKTMCAAVNAHETASLLLRRGKSEVSVFWHCPKTGVLCKARPDYWREEACIVPDLKTTINAAPEAFSKTVANFFYHLQAAHYLEGMEIATGKQHSWAWIVVEKKPPHGVVVYEPDPELLYVGQERMRPLRELYAECTRTGDWPCYSQGITQISLPRWALRNI